MNQVLEALLPGQVLSHFMLLFMPCIDDSRRPRVQVHLVGISTLLLSRFNFGVMIPSLASVILRTNFILLLAPSVQILHLTIRLLEMTCVQFHDDHISA